MSGTNIYPTTNTNTLNIGSTSGNGTTLNVQGGTSYAIINSTFKGTGATNSLTVYNNGRVAVNRNSASYPLHVDGGASFDNSGTYSFILGSIYQIYGNPTLDLQSTSNPPSGQTFSTLTMRYDGLAWSLQPQNAATGKEINYEFRNKTNTWKLRIDSDNQRMGIINTNNPSVLQVSMDFSGFTDGFAVPYGTTAQRGG